MMQCHLYFATDYNLILSRKLIKNDLSVPLCHFCIKKRSITRWSDKRLSVIGTGYGPRTDSGPLVPASLNPK